MVMKKLLVIILVLVGVESMAQTFDRVFVFLNKNPNKEQISEEAQKKLIDQPIWVCLPQKAS